jgi:hypothetical protein
MLDAPAGLPYVAQPETRHHIGSSQRAFHKQLTLFEHLVFFAGFLVIIAVAIVIGLVVSNWAWLLLLLIFPYAGVYFSLIEKDRRMNLLATALEPTTVVEQPPPKLGPIGDRDDVVVDVSRTAIEASAAQQSVELEQSEALASGENAHISGNPAEEHRVSSYADPTAEGPVSALKGPKAEPSCNVM